MAVTVENGVNTTTGEYAGRTVGAIRSMLSQALNIAAEARPYVDGHSAAEEAVVSDGSTLVFIKASGRKGFTSALAERRGYPPVIHSEPGPSTGPLTSRAESMKPFLAIRTEREYDAAVKQLNELVDEIGDNKKDPRYRLIETLSILIDAYDLDHHWMPDASSIEALRFLMEEHRLTQRDLPEIGSQGVVSEVLAGRRHLNLRQIRALAARFGVQPAAFVDAATDISPKRPGRSAPIRKRLRK
jgi:HTH-type transcriptional regulator / antitoxin HigA